MTSALSLPCPVEAIDLEITAPLAPDAAERAAVEAHFARMRATNPDLWNGSFFLFEGVALAAGRFSALARPTDYATFLHWRAAGYPGEARTHVFPVAAVTTADDRLLVGVMGRTTANAGLSYPPSGSFDHDDVVGDRLDPVANMVRELGEEVGIDAGRLAPDPGFTVLRSGPGRLALVKRWRTSATAAELGAEITDHLGGDGHQELGGFDFLPFDRRLAAEATVPYVDTLLRLLHEDALGA